MIFTDSYKEHRFIRDIIPFIQNDFNDNTTLIDLCCRNGFFLYELMKLNKKPRIIINDGDKNRSWFYMCVKSLNIDKVYNEYLIYREEDKQVSDSVNEFLNENNQIRKLALYCYIFNNDIQKECLHKLQDFLNKNNVIVFNENIINIINKASNEDTILYCNLDMFTDITPSIRSLCKYFCKVPSVLYQTTCIEEIQNDVFKFKKYEDGYISYYCKDSLPEDF